MYVVGVGAGVALFDSAVEDTNRGSAVDSGKEPKVHFVNFRQQEFGRYLVVNRCAMHAGVTALMFTSKKSFTLAHQASETFTMLQHLEDTLAFTLAQCPVMTGGADSASTRCGSAAPLG